jgi:hypothetical protein
MESKFIPDPNMKYKQTFSKTEINNLKSIFNQYMPLDKCTLMYFPDKMRYYIFAATGFDKKCVQQFKVRVLTTKNLNIEKCNQQLKLFTKGN